MKRQFTVVLEGNFSQVQFVECTAICSDFPQDGRRAAILVHDLKDELHEGDYVVFESDLPKDESDAKNLLLNEVGDSCSETMDTVIIQDQRLSDLVPNW